MTRFGNDAAGFSVEYDAATHTVAVVAWGFWDADVAGAFGHEVLRVCGSHSEAEGLSVDARDLKPMREEGQASLASVIQALPRHRIRRVTMQTSSQLTKLQLLRITKRRDPSIVVAFS